MQRSSLLNEELPKYIADIKTKYSENAKAYAFSSFIQRVFGILAEELDLEVPITSTTLKLRGRIDVVFGSLIFEFKTDLESKIDDAEEKLKKYLTAYHEKYPNLRHLGIANDGIKFKVYLPHFENQLLVSLKDIDFIDLEKANNEDIFLWFDSYLFTAQKVIPTSRDLKKRFGVDSPTFATFSAKLMEIFELVQANRSIQIKYENWERFLEIIYGDKPAELFLFIKHDRDFDSIWTYILRNMFKPFVISNNKVNVMIGNPPWSTLQFMKDKVYQRYLKTKSLNYLLTDKAQNIAHIELATLFFCQSSDQYLAEDGLIAFVMPKSVLVASHHQNFMKFRKPMMKLMKVYDLESVSPLFRVPSCALFAIKGGKTVYPVKYDVFQGSLRSFNSKVDEARSSLNVSKLKYSPAIRSTDLSYYYDKFSEGSTILPRPFWFVRIKKESDFLGSDPDMPLVESEPNPFVHPPWDVVKIEGNIEKEYLFTTVVSNDLVPFGCIRRRIVILPLIINNNEKIEMILSSKQPEILMSNLSKHLEKAEFYWREYGTQKAKEGEMTKYERLNYQSDLTDQNLKAEYAVLFVSSATYMASCVIKPKAVYSIKVGGSSYNIRNFFADHTTYYYYTNIANEAYYLSAILNSKVLDNLIKPVQARGSFGGPRHVHKNPLSFPIPEYDPKIKLHRDLAQDGECCHNKVRDDILPNVSSRSIGKIRTLIRERLSNEYTRIDTNTSSILNNVKAL